MFKRKKPIIHAEYDSQLKDVLRITYEGGETTLFFTDYRNSIFFPPNSKKWFSAPGMKAVKNKEAKELNCISRYLKKFGSPYPFAHLKRLKTKQDGKFKIR